MEDLLDRLEAIDPEKAALRAWQVATVAEAQRLVPRRTGFLQRNIRPGAIGRNSATVEANAPYAAAVEKGTRPHIIRPRNAKMLAWGGARRLTGRLRSGSKPDHFARIVHHPGTKAQPYLLPGAKKALALFRELIAKRWNDAA